MDDIRGRCARQFMGQQSKMPEKGCDKRESRNNADTHRTVSFLLFPLFLRDFIIIREESSLFPAEIEENFWGK